MAEVGSAAVAIFPSFKGFRSKVENEVETSGRDGGKKFSGAFKGALGALAGLFAADKIITGFKSAINEASGLGESLNALNVVYGENSAGIQKLGQSAAKSLGLSNLEFNNLAVRFSSFSKTIAGEGGNVTGTLQDLTSRASDFASVMNLEVKDAAELFQSGLAGETEPLRAFGIDMSAAAVTAYALEKGIAASASSMTEAQKVQARYGLLMQQTAQTTGDFANTSDQLANQQRIADSRWKNISATIGGLFLPAMTGALGVINTAVLPAVESLVGRLGSGGLGGAFAPIAAVAGPILSTLAAQFAPLIPQVIGLVSAFSPLSLLFQIITPLLPQISSMFTVLTGVISSVLAQVLPLVTTLAAQLIPVFLQLVGGVLPPVISILSEVIGAIAPLISQIAGALIPVIQALMPVVVTVFGVIANVVRSAMQIIQGIIQVVTGVITGNWSQVWNGLVNIVQGTLRTVGSVLAGLRDIVASAIGNVGGWLVNSGRALIQGFIDGITGMIGNIGNAIGGVLEKAREFFPFSPAKRGPFSGRGYTSYSGQALAKDFAGGIDSQQNLVARSANRLMSSAALSVSPVAAGAVGGAGALSARSTPIYVQNPFTGDYLLAQVGSVADGRIQSADSDSQRMRRGR